MRFAKQISGQSGICRTVVRVGAAWMIGRRRVRERERTNRERGGGRGWKRVWEIMAGWSGEWRGIGREEDEPAGKMEGMSGERWDAGGRLCVL